MKVNMTQKNEPTLPDVVRRLEQSKVSFGFVRWNDDLFTSRMVKTQDVECYKVLAKEHRFLLLQGARFSAERNGLWGMPALTVSMPLVITVTIQSMLLSGIPSNLLLNSFAGPAICCVMAVLLLVGAKEFGKRSSARTWAEAFEDAERELLEEANAGQQQHPWLWGAWRRGA